MKHILRINIILSSFVLIFIHRGYAPETPESPETKSCEDWILDKHQLPHFLPGNEEEYKNNANNYSNDIKSIAHFYFINAYNFWKGTYFRYLIHNGSISPKEFCKLIGGESVLNSEISEDMTKLPCYKWILISGYYKDNIEKNIEISKNRVANKLNNILSGYAQTYGEHLLKKDDDGETSSSISTNDKLDPITFCYRYHNNQEDELVYNKIGSKTSTVS